MLMKKYMMSISLCLLCFLQAYGQNMPICEASKDTLTVTTGFSLKFHSDILNEDRVIMISLPEGYYSSTKKYPVLYLLDAQWNFNHASQSIGWLSGKDNQVIPQTIIVGVCTGGEKREHDLTPTIGTGKGGGADSLYLFIKKELIPYIDTNLRTFNYRILAGTSYGGLFVMNAFVKDPLYFNGYLSASPSMWWDNRYMLHQTENLLSRIHILPTRLYLNVANEGISMGVDSLASLFSKYSPQQLAWRFDKHQDEIHYTIMYKGIWDGMKFLLADWYYPLVDFATKDCPLSISSAQVVKPKPVKISKVAMMNYCGLYKDSYGRLFQLCHMGNALSLNTEHSPAFIVYPESKNKFYLNQDDIADQLFLYNVCAELEFPTNDSLTMTVNGKNFCTAKRITHRPILPISEESLGQYIGSYSNSEQNIDFIVTKKDNGLMISYGMLKFKLFHADGHHFFAILNGEVMEIEFTTDDDANTIAGANIMNDGHIVATARKTGAKTN